MFRSMKKKTKRPLRKKDNDEDEEEEKEATPRGSPNHSNDNDEDPTVVVRKHHHHKSTRHRQRGARVSEPAAEVPPRSKRKRPIALGGDSKNDDDIALPLKTNTTTSRYGKDALEQLKAEQSRRQPDPQPVVAVAPTPQAKEEDDTNRLPSYVPMTDGAVLAGEEALQFQKDGGSEEGGEEVDSTMVQPQPLAQEQEDNYDRDEESSWQDQIARRAGISSTTRKNTTVQPRNLSLETLQAQLESTHRQLQTQLHDWESTKRRREAEQEHTRSDWTRQRDALEQAGKACSDYQGIRHELAIWVGALRELYNKVEPIWETQQDWILESGRETQTEWIQWQDDNISLLREDQRVNQVLGRQSTSHQGDENQGRTMVDEFGRDVQSQFVRDRSRRQAKRNQRKHAVSLEEWATDPAFLVLWDRNKDNVVGERYSTLQEALRVALEDLDDDYRNLDNLARIFKDWNKTYADEYKQCYANLSLGDLASVLATVELCQSKWLKSLLDPLSGTHDSTEFDFLNWKSKLTDFVATKDDGESVVERVFGKVMVPFVTSMLKDCPIACFLSNYRSRALSGLVREILLQSKQSSGSGSMREWTKTLGNAMLFAIIDTVGNVSIALSSSTESTSQEDGPMVYAQSTQPEWIQILVLNLLADWVPLLQSWDLVTAERFEEVGGILLGFVSNNYLFLLSSLGPSKASHYFSPLWKSLQTSEASTWLESAALMLQSAPIRAAAAAYGLTG